MRVSQQLEQGLSLNLFPALSGLSGIGCLSLALQRLDISGWREQGSGSTLKEEKGRGVEGGSVQESLPSQRCIHQGAK
jgi:hypothetical protein